MTVEELRDYVSCGREIEFEFKGKRYSITYFEQNKKNMDFFLRVLSGAYRCKNS